MDDNPYTNMTLSQLFELRKLARQSNDYIGADLMRDVILSKNIKIRDYPDGVTQYKHAHKPMTREEWLKREGRD